MSVESGRGGRPVVKWLAFALTLLAAPTIPALLFLWAASSLSGLYGGEVGGDYYLAGAALAVVSLGFVVAVVLWIAGLVGQRRRGAGHAPFVACAVCAASVLLVALVSTVVLLSTA